jgi:hypothetical protein
MTRLARRARPVLLARLRSEERGAALVWLLGTFTIFMLLAAFAVDFGIAFADRRTERKDADAMALAGALDLPDDPLAADANARAWGDRNGVDTAAHIAALDIDNSCWSSDPNDDPAVMDSITVDLSKPGRRFFLGELGAGAFTIGAHAKACVGSVVEATGLRPWAISIFQSPCFELALGGDPLDPYDYTPQYGQECIIRFDNPSQTSSIRLGADEDDTVCSPPGGGANEYKENIIEGSEAPCAIGDIVATQPGNDLGPTATGLATLLASEGACDAAFTVPGDQVGIDDFGEVFDPATVTPGPNVVFTPRNCGWDSDPATPDSPRFVSIVLIDEWDDPTGYEEQPIRGFAGFFIDRCDRLDNSGNVVGAYPKCDFPGSKFQLVGRFIRFMQLAGIGGVLNPWGSRVVVLVE